VEAQATGLSTAEFIRTLFADSPGSLALWRSDTKQTLWTSPADAAAINAFAARAIADNFDAYFGVCLQKRATAGRGNVDSVVAIPGLWADIDFTKLADPDRKTPPKAYPPRDVVELVLQKLPLAPTIVVESGGGLHIYWLFARPLIVAGDADRDRAGAACKALQSRLRAMLLKAGGYALDSTHDLARVLRLPGTPHSKRGGFIVRTIQHAGPQHRIEDIEAAIGNPSPPAASLLLKNGSPAHANGTHGSPPATAATPIPASAPATNGSPSSAPPAAAGAINGRRKKQAGDFASISADSEPPAHKLFNMLEASDSFRRLWEGNEGRKSPSEYDQSLANFAKNAGWTDQEAAALLVAFARRWFPDHIPKLLRVTNGVCDYLQRTIDNAKTKRIDGKPVLPAHLPPPDLPPTSAIVAKAREAVGLLKSIDDANEVAATRQQFIGQWLDNNPDDPNNVKQAFETELSLERTRRSSTAHHLDRARSGIGRNDLIEVVMYGHEEPEFELVFSIDGRRVNVGLGSAANVYSRTKVELRLITPPLRHLLQVKAKDWRELAQSIILAARPIETTDGRKEVASIIIQARHRFPVAQEIPRPEFDATVLKETSDPEIYAGQRACVFGIAGEAAVYIHLDRLIAFAREVLRRSVERSDFAKRLANMQFKKVTIQARLDGKKNRLVRLWRGQLPADAAEGD
jgi:hypothetical protein